MVISPKVSPGTGRAFFLQFYIEEAHMQMANHLLADLQSPHHSMPVSSMHLCRSGSTFYGAVHLKTRHKNRYAAKHFT